MNINQAVAEKTLQFISLCSAFGKRASDRITELETEKKAAAAKRDDLIGHMIAAGVIEPAQKQAVAQRLDNHGGTMDLLKRAVSMIQDQEKQASIMKKAELGSAAGDDGTGSNRVFQPGEITSIERQSDVAFERGLGLA